MQNKVLKTQADINKEKLVQKRMLQMVKRDNQLNDLTDEELIMELKSKQLPSFGNRQERLDRIKKFYGLDQALKSHESNKPELIIKQQPSVPQFHNNQNMPPVQYQPQPVQYQVQPVDVKKKDGQRPKSSVVENIENMAKKREERRLKMENIKNDKAQKKADNLLNGNDKIDVDFQIMIENNKNLNNDQMHPHLPSSQLRLCVCVRKRPIFKKEEIQGEIDSVSATNPKIIIHQQKLRVDGITKYVEDCEFQFDNTFNENEQTEDLYKCSLQPLVEMVFNKAVITCFAYGQTGSGKTHTMSGMQKSLVNDLFLVAKSNQYKSQQLKFYISFYEIYGGRCYDLLNNKNNLNILEDKNQNVQIQGLMERQTDSIQEMLQTMEYANSTRTTKQTTSNDTSSRSHAICQIVIRDYNQEFQGKFLLVDLAGSERAQDCQSNNRQRRIEGAEINKSLLALKECIRSMDSNAQHVPFRASKLTLVLRDSFLSKHLVSKIVMIACVSPGSSSADHSMNTLRYADRLKDRNFDQNAKQKYMQFEQDQLQFDFQQNDMNEYHDTTNIQQGFDNRHIQQGNNLSLEQQIKNQLSAKKKQHYNNNNIQEQHSSDDEVDEDKIAHEKRVQNDIQIMKQTLNYQGSQEQNKYAQNNDQYFDMHDKVAKIVEDQEQVIAIHMAAIKEDAKLLTQESELISNVQGVGHLDFDIDLYVTNLEAVIKKKLKMYNVLNKKLEKFKKHLQEEEESHSRVRDTLYY